MGRLNPALYRGPATSSSSSFASPPLGSVHLSYTWIGEHYDQLKIRILKVKNILEEYSRAGLYFRWEQSGNFNLMSTFNDQLSSLFVHILLTMDTMNSQDVLKTIAQPLFLNLFFYFLLQLLCVMISYWLTVLKHKMLSQILIKNTGLVW